MKKWFLLSLALFLLSVPYLAQDFPEGRIAFALPSSDCIEPINTCTNAIKIINPNTGESIIIDTGEKGNLWGETLSLSPDGRYIAYMTRGYILHFVELDTLAEVGTIQFYEELNSAIKYTWHPTLPLMAFVYETEIGGSYHLFLFDLIKHQWHPLAEDIAIQDLSRPRWSPDGLSLLVFGESTSNNLSLYQVDVMTNQLHKLTDELIGDWSPYWSQDGQRIVFSTGEDRINQIVVVDVATGTPKIVYHNQTEGASIGGPQWILDDQYIGFPMGIPDDDYDFAYYRLELATGEVELVMGVPPYFVGFDLSPDKTALVYLASDEHEKDVCIVSLSTFDNTCLNGEKAYFISYPVWSN